jgi:D-alanyl-D-alanine carboxypeptidase/D-alanyl-D-alanine-endopeptidase (penicillin-binding protein 4)
MSFRNSTIAVAIAATAACHASTGSRRPAGPPSPQGTAVGQLQHSLESILNDPPLAHGTWGVLVQSLKSGETLFAWNPQKLLLPASNMKLVTLAAAASHLGWDYTYRTTLLANGSISGGVLAGDLIVVGSGDPSIGNVDGSAERLFGEWADRLKQLGVRAIAGRIVGDDNAFDDEILGFGWSWDDLPEDYAAGVGALQFNENAVRVTVSPGPKAGDPAGIAVDPPESGIVISNAVRTSAPGTAANLSAHRLPGRNSLAIGGSIAAGAEAPAVLTMSVDNPTEFFVRALRRSLIARGIDVRGPAIDIDDLDSTLDRAGATTVADHRSAPLSVLAVRLMRISQNQYAETFLKSLGMKREASTTERKASTTEREASTTEREALAERSPATALKGRTVAERLFKDWGVDPGSLIIRDGSGLSRYDFLTAQALVTILTHVYKDSKLYEPFAASLPTPGTDGTLANRLKGTAVENRLRAKTGSMSQVRALSGYITTSDDEPLVFSIIANNFDTTADVINRATDAMLIKLAEFRR